MYPGPAPPPVAGYPHGTYNTLRGLLRELGYPLPVGARACHDSVPALLQPAIDALLDEIVTLETHMADIEVTLARQARESDTVQLL